MKAIWFSDLHIKEERQEQIKLVFDYILEKASEHKVDYFINTGDTFDDKNILVGTELDIYRQFLLKATKIAPVISVVGNHDWCKEYSVHSLQGFSDIKNHIIVDSSFKLNDKVGFLGYRRTESAFKSILKEVIGCEYLFGHFDMVGFEIGSGYEETNSWSDISLFKKFKKVFSGHYHKAQTKTSDELEVVYCGTQYTVNFGEHDHVKRLCIVDLETGDIQSLETGFNFHKLIKISAKDDAPVIEPNSFNKYKIQVTGSKEEISKFKKPDNYQGMISFKRNDMDTERMNIDFDHDNKTNDADVVKSYVTYSTNIKKITLPCNEENLIKIGMDYLARALESKKHG